MQVSFIEKSGNGKTGPIPVSYQPSSTCPTSCPHRDAGCYARFHHTGRQWRRLDAGDTGISWKAFLLQVGAIPVGDLWRYGVAGDLPGDGDKIDAVMLRQLIEANRGKEVIAYSHKPPVGKNAALIAEANREGFTINLSADTLGEANWKASLRIGPVVLTMPESPDLWPKATSSGIRIVPCPAVTKKSVTCKDCRLCAKSDRKVIIGFPAHGTGKRMVGQVFMGGNNAKSSDP